MHDNVSFNFIRPLSLLTGTLTKLEVPDGIITNTTELEEDSYEGLSQIDISTGLRLNL